VPNGNVFDKAARYAAKLDAARFLAWALGRPPLAFHFREWLDTRHIPFPGGDDRTGDTVAGLDNRDASGVPWAMAVEFQIEPDPLMFGRMLVYLGGIWLGTKPDPERGSRYAVGGVVVYLTGRGTASREFVWTEAGVKTDVLFREWGLASESAADLLARIGTGAVANVLLPWVPLMTGADEPGIVGQWKRLAEAEPDIRLRADYAALARIFAEAAGRKDFWTEQLRGWNVRQSSVVNEWVEEGRVEGRVEGRQEGARIARLEMLEAHLTTRFGPLSEETLAALRALPDDRLRAVSLELLSAKSLAELGL
jgi:hypothetical protein